MQNDKTVGGLNALAAVCFAVQIIFDMLMGLVNAIRWEEFRYLFTFINFDNLLCIAFAVVLLMGRKNIALAVVSGIYLLFRAYYLLRFLSLGNAIYFLAAAALFFIVLAAVLPALEQLREIANMLFFLPAALMGLSYIISLIRYFNISLYTLANIIYIAGFLLIGLWLKNGAATAKASSQPYIVPDGVSPEDAQILRNFKNLLDKKLITPEMLAAKEQEILAKYNKTE